MMVSMCNVGSCDACPLRTMHLSCSSYGRLPKNNSYLYNHCHAWGAVGTISWGRGKQVRLNWYSMYLWGSTYIINIDLEVWFRVNTWVSVTSSWPLRMPVGTPMLALLFFPLIGVLVDAQRLLIAGIWAAALLEGSDQFGFQSTEYQEELLPAG